MSINDVYYLYNLINKKLIICHGVPCLVFRFLVPDPHYFRLHEDALSTFHLPVQNKHFSLQTLASFQIFRNVPAETTSPEPERFFRERKKSSLPLPPTPSRRPPWLIAKRGLMDLRYRACIWYRETLDGISKDWNICTFEVHQKYIRYILTRVEVAGNFLFCLTKPPFFNRFFLIVRNWFWIQEQRLHHC